MERQTLGALIAARRKDLGMTQLELAEKMGVTDKAVSKWERDLSCPDINTLPRLAELFGLSLDELLRVKASAAEKEEGEQVIAIGLRAVALGMGVAVTVLSVMGKVEAESAIGMLGLGLLCLALVALKGK